MQPLPSLTDLVSILGKIDIYLLDQLLKGTITQDMRVLDAGCGNGRNIHYLLQAGVTVYGVDLAAEAIDQVQQLAASVAPAVPETNFIVADLAALPYPDAFFDVVICSAVLHFSRDQQHFESIIQEVWRVLKPGGMLFARFSTTIGLERKFPALGNSIYQMPHGEVWFLADEALLQRLETTLQATRLEPLKTVVVEQERSMTTWVLRK